MRDRDGYGVISLLVIALTAVAAGCGGGGGDGTTGSSVAVSGNVATDVGAAAAASTGTGETFRVRATSSAGSLHDTDIDSVTGHFTLMLPATDSYVMGFDHRDIMDGQMHSAGHMVFSCGSGQSDRFFLSGRERAVDLGTITVRPDGSFAQPGHNPLDELDQDGNGIPDSRDPHMQCIDVGDHNHDGFYDDDMNHDGYHDDDMNHDGIHDCDMDRTGGGMNCRM